MVSGSTKPNAATSTKVSSPAEVARSAATIRRSPGSGGINATALAAAWENGIRIGDPCELKPAQAVADRV